MSATLNRTAGQHELDGRTILITGASSGLGRAFVIALAKAGATTIAAARRDGALRDLAATVAADGGRCLPIPLDVTSEASVLAAFDTIEKETGIADIVVVNAGINVEGAALDLPMEAFDRLVAVNLRGAFLTAREAARRLIAAERPGRIILIASIGGHSVLPGVAAYCASKAGVIMLGKSLAREWGRRDINVNIVCPGFVETDLNARWFRTEAGQRQVRRFPRRRLVEPSDVVDLVLYLCSCRASAITGAVLIVDDGQSL